MPVDDGSPCGARSEARGLLPLVRQGVATPEEIRSLVLLTPAHRRSLIESGIDPIRVSTLAIFREKVWQCFEESLAELQHGS
jgi:hypothetical protein